MTTEAKRAYMADWYQKNKARLSAERKEYLATYYQEHKDEIAQSGRAYRDKHAAEIAVTRAAYRATPEAREVSRAWNSTNVERRRELRRQDRARHPETRWDYDLRTKFGITLDDYRRMLDEQGGVCAVCFGPPDGKRKLAVDHDHQTGAIRGLLCNSCNLAAGKLKESPEVVASLYAYMVAA